MRPSPLPWAPYCGAAPEPAEWLVRWNADPVLLSALAIFAAFGFMRQQQDPTERWAFAGGLAMLVLLFVSPLCALTSALFSARAVHHALLIAIAAPLLSRALLARRSSLFAHLPAWTAGHAAIFWIWHWPPLYGAALANDAVYWLMQLSLLGSAMGFWAALRHAPVTSAIAALLAAMVQMGLLGAILTFAASPLYAPHFLTTQAWGMAPLADQQLAGLIMWAPAAGLYLLAALLLASRWLRSEADPVVR